MNAQELDIWQGRQTKLKVARGGIAFPSEEVVEVDETEEKPGDVVPPFEPFWGDREYIDEDIDNPDDEGFDLRDGDKLHGVIYCAPRKKEPKLISKKSKPIVSPPELKIYKKHIPKDRKK